MNLRGDEVKQGHVDRSALKDYLERKFGMPLDIDEIRPLGSLTEEEGALKQFGFGKPIFVRFRTDEGERKVVFHRIRENAFGREREDDRVSAVWLDYQTFNELPEHVPALDMMIRVEEGCIRSIGDAVEILLLTGHRSGETYAQDLVRIGEQRKLEALDLGRAGSLA